MFYKGDALKEIAGIKILPDGHLDMKTLPKFATSPNGGRDLGAMVSILTVAIQQLLARIEKLEKAKENQ